MTKRRAFISGMFISMLVCLLCIGTRTARGADVPFPAFGTGKTEVRLYTDYFCEPCRKASPLFSKTLDGLIKKNRITLKIIDLPLHSGSIMYARYFLYALNAGSDYADAMAVRKALYDAAATKKVTTKEQLETVLKRRGLAFKEFDPRPSFEKYQALIKEDQARSTPTCVIVGAGGKKKVAHGSEEILAALKNIK